ncbi:hypothetical protein DT73_22540 [Mangrovibacter sp. MFB070]|uniref:hypothetical protein n=1 Tax=Mangrovibacter sp. MFB070 TaxID=1224318 RepID=UPI0004D9613B|nr:hypothetical protein [Mangrovibacter sp. MFB070]KEA50514.1 hypothetical protein DT73_22540 [Mangrovibacter sp. MFB070]
MYKQVAKPKNNSFPTEEHKKRSVSSSVSQNKNNERRGFSFIDNRTLTVSQERSKGNHQLKSQSQGYSDVIQGAFIAVIGEEVPAGSTTLHDGAVTLMGRFGESSYYTEEDISNGDFKTPLSDETIYLIAHGDNPGISLTKEAALGGKSGGQVKNIVKSILQKFSNKYKGEQFVGRIILEGCHTAEPVIDEDKKAGKGSMLYDFQQAMKDDKFFKKNMAPQATIGGYMGQAFSSGNYDSGYGIANTEHPLTIRYQKQRGVPGTKNKDGSISYNNEESFIESRWGKKLEFGNPK